MEAHHYCSQLTQEFAQCVLYDGNTADARLMGVEYIVSARVYEGLPADAKAPLARPQAGVDAMAGRLPKAGSPTSGGQP